MTSAGIAFVLAITLLVPACRSSETRVETASASASNEASHPPQSVRAPLGLAKVGEVAPDFALPDLDGGTVRLSDFKGKTVVLEWFNPGCPYVGLSHTKGSLRTGLANEGSCGSRSTRERPAYKELGSRRTAKPRPASV